MATTPQGALLLPQGRYIHLFQPLHTPKGHCLGVVGGGGGGGVGGTKRSELLQGHPRLLGETNIA